MLCNKDHSSIQKIMQELPDDQGGIGRHKCAPVHMNKVIKMAATVS